MREPTATQAEDLCELVSERVADGALMILVSNRAPVDRYPLFPNPVVAESHPDQLINASHQVFIDGPTYRPTKRPGANKSTAEITEGGDQAKHQPGPTPEHNPGDCVNVDSSCTRVSRVRPKAPNRSRPPQQSDTK
jgi:hypothetical protein